MVMVAAWIALWREETSLFTLLAQAIILLFKRLKRASNLAKQQDISLLLKSIPPRIVWSEGESIKGAG
jgi:hypothetical protein